MIDKAFLASKSQLFVGNCSRQLGKTYWAVTKAVEQALKQPKSQIRYGAAFQSDLVEFIIPAFNKVMDDCPKGIKGKFKTKGNKFVFPNGSEVKLVGLDRNPDGLRGNTLDLIILDECGFVNNLDYLYKSIIIPATTHRPNARIILISTPPSTPAHPFVDYCAKAELEQSYSMFTVHQNPMLDQAAIDRLMKESGGADSTTWRREYLCEFVTDSDLAIIPEWKDEYIQTIIPNEYYNYYHKYVGMDLGTKDFTALVFGYYDFKNATLVIQDEMVMNGPSMNTDKLVKAIRAKEDLVWQGAPPFRRISDNNNLMLLQDMSSLHNLHFSATNKDTLEAMINEVRIMVGAGRIIVDPKCKMMSGCLKYGVWNTKKTQFARSGVYGHYDHLAALIYLVRNLAKHTNPIPVDHGFVNHKAWLGNVKDQIGTTETSRVLSKALRPKIAKPKIN